jgi:hypothetical protein
MTPAKIRALVILSSLGVLSAAIRLSLYIERCSWDATDILVVSPADAKAGFRVIEAIKGDTQIGTVLVLPELAPRDDVALRPLRELIDMENPFRAPVTSLTAPAIGAKDRVIVFLRRPGALPEYNPRPDLPVNTDGWQPADLFANFLTSAIWLQDGAAYGFVQNVNPGPSHLVELRSSEDKIRDEIHTVLLLRDALDRALANPDPVTRCKELAALVQPKWRSARFSALKHLEGGGTAAAAALFDLLADPTLLEVHSGILDALVKTRPQDLDLGPMLEAENRYWIRTCSTLQPGWWNSSAIQGDETPRSHYGRVYATLRAIRALHLEKNLPQVRDFAVIWNECPTLEKDQVSEECDLLLNAAPHPHDP